MNRTPMPLNQEKVASLVGEASKAISSLEQYRDVDDKLLLSNEEKLGNIKYQFIVALEACIDLCNYIVARSFMEAPESYAHCFELLAEKGILDASLARKMSELAKFRNVLVHLYWKVDDQRVIDLMKKELPTIRRFLKVIAGYTEGRS